jgi:hypothetical protein
MHVSGQINVLALGSLLLLIVHTAGQPQDKFE